MNRSSGSSTFDSDDRLSTETYDANGNVLTTASKTFTYDSENHLMSMGSTVGLLYDGDGDRVAKTVSGVTTYYLVDDLNPTGYPQVVDELSGSGSVTRQYTYGLQRISQEQAISSTWTPSFYGYDGGGTVRALTNSAGTVTDTYEYDAFGNLLNPASSGTPNNYLYRGEELDTDLGLYYLRARYMNPLTGRFMSRDPERGKTADPRSLHKYLYVADDPVNLIDPRGRGSLVENALIRSSIFIEVTVPAYISGVGVVKFWGTVGGLVATGGAVAQFYCELSGIFSQDLHPAHNTVKGSEAGGCGVGEEDPGPGPFEPDQPPPVMPGGAGAQR